MKDSIDLSCQGNLRRRVKLTWVVGGIGEVCGEFKTIPHEQILLFNPFLFYRDERFRTIQS